MTPQPQAVPAARLAHTPGPWHANTAAEDCYADGANIREPIRGEVVAVSLMPNRANAQIMAAAPELLAALRECLAEVNWYAPKGKELGGVHADDVRKQARAAIAKAGGAQ